MSISEIVSYLVQKNTGQAKTAVVGRKHCRRSGNIQALQVISSDSSATTWLRSQIKFIIGNRLLPSGVVVTLFYAFMGFSSLLYGPSKPLAINFLLPLILYMIFMTTLRVSGCVTSTDGIISEK